MSLRARLVTAALVAVGLAFDPGAANASTARWVLALALGVVLLALGIGAGTPLRLPLGSVLALLVLGWLGLSLAWSTQPADGAVEVASWLGVLLAGLGVAQLAERRRVVEATASVLVTVTAAIALGQWLAGARGIAVHGGLGNPNWLGISLMVGLPLVTRRRVGWVVWGLGLCALALSASRSAWLGAVVGFPLLLPRRLRLPAWILGGVGAVAVIGWSQDGALEGRWWIWRHALAAWREAPLLGHGAGSFAPAWLAAQGRSLAALPLDEASHRFLFPRTAHEDWLELAVSGGAVALALGMAAGLGALASSWRRFRAGSASLLGLGVAMLGDAALHQPMAVLFASVILASGTPLRRGRAVAPLRLALVTAGALALPGLGLGWLAERRARAAAERPPDERVALLEAAHRLAPERAAITFELGLAELSLGDAEAALTYFDAAPVPDVGRDVARGNALVALDRLEAAVASYRAALATHPASFAAHLNLAEALRRLGKLDEASHSLAQAAELQPHHPKLAPIRESLRRARIEADTR
ncbi:MAG: tetratricopeptide repeat protein [Polyangiaceae bacterium]